MRRFSIPILLLATLLIFSGCIYGLWGYASCRFETMRLSCYQSRVDHVARWHGTVGALEYVDKAVFPYSGYGLVHLVLHRVGERAYEQSRGYAKAMSFLRPYEERTQTDDLFKRGFDGYRHGVLSSLALNVGGKDVFQILAQNACDPSSEIMGKPGGEFFCYHSVGHALVYANGNKLAPSLRACASATSSTARSGCEFGSFMEMAALYSPQYHSESSHSEIRGVSMRSFCDRFSGTQERTCDEFVGEAFYDGHAGDLDGAFKECEALRTNQDACVSRLAEVDLASLVSTDADVFALCNAKATVAYRETCTSSAQSSLHKGMKNYNAHTRIDLLSAISIIALYYF